MPFRIRIFLSVFLALLVLALVGPFLIPAGEPEGTSDARSLASEYSRFAEIEGVEIHYREDGSGEPAYLLLHGYPANLASWRDIIPELSLTGRVIAFDRPGFGLSERPERGSWPRGANPYSPSAHLDQAVGLLDELGVDSAIWVGSSSGALTALEAAATHPERVESLVLIGAPVYATRAPPAWSRFILASPQMTRLGPLLMRELGADAGINLYGSQWANQERIDQEDIDAYRLTFAVDDWDRGLWEVSKANRESPVADDLARVSVPALVVAGAQDQIVAPEDSQRLASELPSADFALMEGCGHVPHEECPLELVETMLAWLEQ